jgi:hypothetical protein
MATASGACSAVTPTADIELSVVQSMSKKTNLGALQSSRIS